MDNKKTKWLLIGAAGVMVCLSVWVGISMMNAGKEEVEEPKQTVVKKEKVNQTKVETASPSGKTNEEFNGDVSAKVTSVERFIIEGKFDKAVEEMEALTNDYSLTEKDNEYLASLLSDAELLLGQALDEDGSIDKTTEAFKQVETAVGLNYGLLYFYGQLENGLALDVQSYDITGQAVPSNYKTTVYKKGDERINEIARVKRFATANDADLQAIYQFDFFYNGADVTSYVIQYETGKLALIGYYSDDPFAVNVFRTVQYNIDIRDELNEALETNWGEGY